MIDLERKNRSLIPGGSSGRTHLSSGCTAHELLLETPAEAVETPEGYRTEDGEE